jgi:hypothetical protein
MAITSSQSNGNGVDRHSSGSFLEDDTAADVTIELGFAPRYFRWVNETDRIEYEWYEGMAADTTIKTVAAGTRTLDTADAAINVDGSTVTVAAAAAIADKQCRWVAR